MNAKTSIRQWSYMVGAVALMVFSCTITTADLAGNSTQTGNGTMLAVAGVLFEPDGKTPAPDARVSIRQLESGDRAIPGAVLKKSGSAMETFTDGNGEFVFGSLRDRGPYIIEADRGETLFAMIEYVAFAGTDSSVFVEDTLKAPGSIKAVVCLDYPDRKMGKTTFIAGVYAYYKSDMNDTGFSNAQFSIGADSAWIDSAYECNGVIDFNNLAEGIYTFMAHIQLPYEETKTKKRDLYLKKPAIVVTSGQVTDLDTLRFPEMDIPDVAWCGAGGYDPITGTVHIYWDWNAWDTGKVAGVNIYQQLFSPALPLKINAVPVTGTVFADTGFWDFPRRPIIEDIWLNPDDSTFDTVPSSSYSVAVQAIAVSYFLASVDTNGNEAWKVHSVSPSSIWWKREDGIPFLPDTLW